MAAFLAAVLATACGTGERGSPASSGEPATPTDQAIATAQAHIRHNPDDVTALDELAAAYLQKVREVGDPSYYQKVDGLLRLALGKRATDGRAAILMGALSLARHQFSTALEWGHRAADLAPGVTAPLGVIADALTELGRYDEAAATVQRMVDLRPDLSSYTRASYVLELHGEVSGAIAAMQQAVDAGGPVPENVAYAEALLGNLYYNSGRLPEAERHYQRASQIFPSSFTSLGGLAQVRAAQGRFQEALALYEHVLAIYPAPQFVIGEGDVYAVIGDTARSEQRYQLAEAENRLFQDSGVNLDAELALFLADHRRDLGGAMAAARRASVERPSVTTFDIVSWTLYQNGQLPEALSAARQARRLGTQDALIFFHSGMIESRLGMRVEARDDLAKALAVNPHFSLLWAPVARQTLASLGG